ncbi:MAG TPA: excinuclease ABC subunit UvrC [Desulfobacterales bacterium]|nr:excinuclease ABC subunit UvrC [Desulfobacterales bacterium]
MNDRIRAKLLQAPSNPGVYLFKDAAGQFIYVGKAQNLRKRLASYFTNLENLDIKSRMLVKKLSVFETIITGTEQEALILESNLIKQHKPKYNIDFKDDKRYPSLRLDVKSQYPTLAIVRKTGNDGAIYFGPFASAQSVRQTLRIIHKTFKLRSCKANKFRNRSRPCLNFQIGICLAPCSLDVDRTAYHDVVKEVTLFLKGRTPFLIQKIKKEMVSAAKKQNYETAATLRDKMYALEKTLEKQVSVTTDFKDRDILALARDAQLSLITLLFVRGGFLLGTRHFSFKETLSTEEESIGAFIKQYYGNTHFIPQEILIPLHLEDASLIEDWLGNIKGKKVRIIFPKRGEKTQLLKMGVQNAENELQNLIASKNAEIDLIRRLQKLLKMNKAPERIECFDNSNISGASPVAGMIVFEMGKPKKSDYRRYKIKTVPKQNDYAYMAEVLGRRYKRKDGALPPPDLLLIDGGKGQLNIAKAILKQLNLKHDFETIAIAKKDKSKGETEDKIYKPGRVNPLNFGKERDLLLFLQRIRNEAHRFAISFHRKQRGRTSMHSALDSIEGIGKKRKETLFKHYGSIQKIRKATLSELAKLPGMNKKAAQAVKVGRNSK